MSAGAKFVVLVIIVAAFGAVGWFFHKELVGKEPDVNEVRKAKLQERKDKKSK